MLKKINCFIISVVLLLSMTACSLALPDSDVVDAQGDYLCGVWIMVYNENQFHENIPIDPEGFRDPEAAVIWNETRNLPGEPYVFYPHGQNFTNSSFATTSGSDYDEHATECTVSIGAGQNYITSIPLYIRPDGTIYADIDNGSWDLNEAGYGGGSFFWTQSHYENLPDGSKKIVTYTYKINYEILEDFDHVEIATLSADYRPIETQNLNADEMIAQAQGRTVTLTVPENCEYLLITEIRRGGSQETAQPALFSRHQEMFDHAIQHSLAISSGPGIAKIYVLNIIFA